jgi:hypothetical protein
MPQICLSFIFNHQYEKNIPKLREIYGDRFSTIKYLSPFSTYMDDDGIIPIYETSINFQGYIAQSYKYLPNDCDYYVFCADDLLLNPDFNENNILDKLNCKNTSYIKYLNPIWEHSFAWHKFEECNSYPNEGCNIDYPSLLPSRIELLEKYKEFGIHYRNINLENFRGIHDKTITRDRIWSGLKYLIKTNYKRYVHLPLIEGYSDFIIIPSQSLKSFCHYCGIFSAMNIWVDAAVATAMILSSDQIRTEKDHSYKGTEIWNENELRLKTIRSKNKLEQIIRLFEDDEFYIHPIKLSKFT